MTPPGRLSLRLALLVGALGALLALALGAMAHWNLGRELEARERENLQLKLEQIRHSLEDDLDLRSDPAVQAHALQDQLVAHSGLHLSILDSRSGQPLMSFGDQAAASVAANRALLARLQADARQPVFQSWSTGNDQRLLSIGASMRMKNGTPVQVLLSSERNADERLLDGFLRATLLALPFLLPLIALAAWWVVRAGLEPLNRFRRVAAQVSPQDLSYRIPEQNLPRELDSLARSFNHMLGRLEDGVRQLSQFSDDLAHELRAPICNLLVRNPRCCSASIATARHTAKPWSPMPRNWSGCRGSSPTCCSWCRWTTRRSRPSSAASPCTSRRPRSSTCTRWSPRTRASSCACPAAASPTATT